MNEIRYETPIESVDWRQLSIFLAGPTVRGNQPHLSSWRPAAIQLLQERKFDGNVIIPEFASRDQSDKYRYDIPMWEFAGLNKADIILFWIPRTKELIGLTTNHEHGYWLARDSFKMVYGRPDDAYRISYLDVMWFEDAKRRGINPRPIYNTLEKTIDAALKKLAY